MKLSDFDFALPEAQIAQEPLPTRDASRLCWLDRAAQTREHRRFAELPALLREGDLLVVNDARVVPARLLGHKLGTGGRAELLLVRPASSHRAGEALAATAESVEWICLGQASKGFKPGAELQLAAGLRARIEASLGGGEYRVRFRAEAGASLANLLEEAGRLPLPPYIEREPTEADRHRYQTVYARAQGSVAAPTAGLHFTPELFEALRARGIERATLTLDVGPGTFLPVREDDVERHRMHGERYEVPAETAEAIAATRARGGRVVAVGTTVVRTLESATDEQGRLRVGPGASALFIRPGFRFRQVDALVTNFHLPRSTLLMLVCAFAGQEAVLAAYRDAVERGYRFFSYGDAMLLT
jgi:S-adenosylmethionine:tRNA ribosyltransferase-isomerase